MAQGFAPLRADENFYATALNNVYQTSISQSQQQVLTSTECTVCGNSYAYELEKDANGCAVCHNCRNNTIDPTVNQASLQLVNSARLSAQQNVIQPTDLESAYKLYSASNVTSDSHMIKIVSAESSNAGGSTSAATSSANVNISTSSHSQKPRTKKPPVS